MANKRRNYKTLYVQLDSALSKSLKEIEHLKRKLQNIIIINRALDRQFQDVCEKYERLISDNAINFSNVKVLFEENEQLKQKLKEMSNYGLD